MRKKPPCRPGLANAPKNHHEEQRSEGVRRPCVPRSKEPHWGSLGTRGSRYRRSMGLATFPTTSERLKRATRKSTVLRGVINKVSQNSRIPVGSSCSLVQYQSDSFIKSLYTDIRF